MTMQLRRTVYFCFAAVVFTVLFAVLFAAALPGAASAAGGTSYTLSYPANRDCPESRVLMQSVNGRSWLMLPRLNRL